MLRILSSLALGVIVVPAAHAHTASQSETNTAQHVTTIVSAKVINRVLPKYPISAAKKGHEGWVRVSFIVEPDGKTSNPIIQASSGGKSFEKAALKAIKNWRYSPAIENGKAIQQCENAVQLDFKMTEDLSNKVSKRFLRLYKKAQGHLEKDNLTEVKVIIDKINSKPLVTHGENLHLNYIQLEYAEKIGDTRLELDTLNKILSFNNFYNYIKQLENQDSDTKTRDLEQEKTFILVLNRKLIHELQQNKINEALYSVNNLLKLAHDSKNLSLYKNQRQKIIDFIASETPLVTSANIEKNDFWYYRLVRNDFSFADIQGDLHKLDIRCNNKRHVYTINDQSTWKIPKSWQKCQLFVYGDNNTTFKLIEHGNQKATDDQVGHESISG